MVVEIYDALKEAGTSEDKARAAASVITPGDVDKRLDDIEKHLATLDMRITQLDKRVTRLEVMMAMNMALIIALLGIVLTKIS